MAIVHTQQEIQDAFDKATDQKFPHYSVQLPEWDNDKPTLEDNLSNEPAFHLEKHPLNCVYLLESRIDELRKKYSNQLRQVTAKREVEDTPGSEPGPILSKVPHPESDGHHVDPVFDPAKKNELRKAVQAVSDLMDAEAGRDGDLALVYSQAEKPLKQARELLDENPKGMQRLRLVFEWAICQVTTLFGEINSALENTDLTQGKKAYEVARKKYIDLLKDLDDHEPQIKGKPRPVPGERGYGRSVKWAYILPLIHGGRIKGAKVVAKWNPHISSSGIPIPHA